MQNKTWSKWLRWYGPVVALYVLLTWSTGALLMGDTVVYADSILTYEHGGAGNLVNPFWDFGHLLWRPLCWLFFRAFRPFAGVITGPGDRAQVAAALMVLSWIAGLAAVLLARSLISRIAGNEWIATLATAVLVTSYGFINYAQTGTAYMPGLTLLLLAVWSLAEESDQAPLRRIVIASVSLAGSICLWFPYVVAVPAA